MLSKGFGQKLHVLIKNECIERPSSISIMISKRPLIVVKLLLLTYIERPSSISIMISERPLIVVKFLLLTFIKRPSSVSSNDI